MKYCFMIAFCVGAAFAGVVPGNMFIIFRVDNISKKNNFSSFQFNLLFLFSTFLDSQQSNS